ncbi:MAG: hypothetical protein JNJ54_03760 [Myxococcaceae bacterium]|nr:hypothetical protein [Myxococcaceae bacterium]
MLALTLSTIVIHAAPLVFLDASLGTSGKGRVVMADVSFEAPVEQTVTLGSPDKPWCKTVSLTVTGQDGKPRAWPWKMDTKCSPRVTLTGSTRYAARFMLEGAAAAKLGDGLYEVSASFEGVRPPPVELLIGDEAALGKPWADLPRGVPALVTALREGPPVLRRRALEVALDAELVTAPPLAAGAETDELIASHLTDVVQAMSDETNVYSHSSSTFAPRNSLLFDFRVLLFPGASTAGFSKTLRGRARGLGGKSLRGMGFELELATAKTPAGFWTHVLEKRSAGILVHPVRVRDDVARVAITIVYPEGVEELTHVGFWAREGAAWKRVVFEPLTPRFEPRDWWSNVHRPGPASSRPRTVWPEEQKSRLETRVQVLQLLSTVPTNTARVPGPSDFSGLDASLLEAYRTHPSPAVRTAVILGLEGAGRPVTLDELMLVAAQYPKRLPDGLQQAIRRHAEAHFARVQPAPDSESPPIMAALRPARGGGARSLDNAGVAVRISNELARVDLSWFDEGESWLLRREADGWKLVCSLGGWIH